MFDSVYGYATICFVASLITGVFNERPPQPTHTFIWDVQMVMVIEHIKNNWPDNDVLSERSLIL